MIFFGSVPVLDPYILCTMLRILGAHGAPPPNAHCFYWPAPGGGGPGTKLCEYCIMLVEKLNTTENTTLYIQYQAYVTRSRSHGKIPKKSAKSEHTQITRIK